MTSARTIVVVQARRRSTRLPDKVTQRIDDLTVLDHVLIRCRAIPGQERVVCAVPFEDERSEVAEIARARGAMVFAGPEGDVLARYLGAARAASADVIMRVTSDCPLIDPDICGAVIDLRLRMGADYASNNLIRTFPHGLDCEVFTLAALEQAHAMATEPYDREHVTPWMRRAASLQRANFAAEDASHVSERWTLDYPEDLAFLRALYQRLPRPAPEVHMQGVLEALDRDPALRTINAMHIVS